MDLFSDASRSHDDQNRRIRFSNAMSNVSMDRRLSFGFFPIERCGGGGWDKKGCVPVNIELSVGK